jgi:hypothetical protein
MGFIREPEGVDFVIEPSTTAKEDIAFISNFIRRHKEKCKAVTDAAENTGNGIQKECEAND